VVEWIRAASEQRRAVRCRSSALTRISPGTANALTRTLPRCELARSEPRRNAGSAAPAKPEA